jgi:hypothetical protein
MYEIQRLADEIKQGSQEFCRRIEDGTWQENQAGLERLLLAYQELAPLINSVRGLRAAER